MTQIIAANQLNTLALGAPKAIVAIQTPTAPIVAVNVQILGLVGVGSWGPINLATLLSGNDNAAASFGPVTNRSYDISTAVMVGVQQFCPAYKGVRVTDGTDTAASGSYSTSETVETATIGGTITNGDSEIVQITPEGGSMVTLTIPIVTADTTTTVATKLAAAINGNATLKAAGFAATSAAAVCKICYPSGSTPTFGKTDGTSITCTLASSSVSVAKISLTGLYSGVVGNGIVATIQPGTAANSTKIVIARPGYAAESFDNITGTGNLLWANMAAAVNNGNSPFRGPSRLCIATAGPGAAAGPSTATQVTMSGATDGAAITDSALFGQDTAPRKGIYALRGSGVGVAIPIDLATSTDWTNYAALGEAECFMVEAATAAGDTVTSAATELATAGLDSYAMKIDFGDWVYWFDPINNVQRLLSPATFLAARRASLAPQHSVLNKQINGVIGTQKTFSGGVWADPDRDAIYQARMDLLCNPVPGGAYWGSNGGINSSSNAAINGDNYTMMTNYIARSVANWAGTNIGELQTPDQRADAKAAGDKFFFSMWKVGQIGNADSANGVGTPPWSVLINDQTTPPDMAAAGYEIAAVRVQYLAVIRWFIVNLMGGQTVSVAVSATPPGFSQAA